MNTENHNDIFSSLEANAHAPRTRLAYAKAIKDFEKWHAAAMAGKDRQDAFAVYLKARATADISLPPADIFMPRWKIAGARTFLAAAADAGLDSPSAKAKRGLFRIITADAANYFCKTARPILSAEILTIAATPPATSRAAAVKAARDKAMILIGWIGLLRGREILELDIGDLAPNPARVESLNLRRRKNTAPGGVSRVSFLDELPESLITAADASITALNLWLHYRQDLPTAAPLFCVTAGPSTGDRIKSFTTLEKIIKTYALDASSHSLRRGGAQSRRGAGQSLESIARLGGWSSAAAMHGYLFN